MIKLLSYIGILLTLAVSCAAFGFALGFAYSIIKFAASVGATIL